MPPLCLPLAVVPHEQEPVHIVHPFDEIVEHSETYKKDNDSYCPLSAGPFLYSQDLFTGILNVNVEKVQLFLTFLYLPFYLFLVNFLIFLLRVLFNSFLGWLLFLDWFVWFTVIDLFYGIQAYVVEICRLLVA